MKNESVKKARPSTADKMVILDAHFRGLLEKGSPVVISDVALRYANAQNMMWWVIAGFTLNFIALFMAIGTGRSFITENDPRIMQRLTEFSRDGTEMMLGMKLYRKRLAIRRVRAVKNGILLMACCVFFVMFLDRFTALSGT